MVPWRTQIRADWPVRALKYDSHINKRALPESTGEAHSFHYIDIGSVDSLGRIDLLEEMTFGSAPSRARRIVKAGDTLVSTVRTYLRAVAFIQEDNQNLIASTGFAVITPSPGIFVPRFLSYWLRSSFFVDEVCARSNGVSYPATNACEVGSILAPSPSLQEQAIIADFLDRKTEAIDGLIAKKERLIALLQEKRQALITQAVTKGLDPTVPMKDSGIEWLGQIPAHWEATRLGRISLNIQTGPFGSQIHADEYITDGIPLINPSHLVDGSVVPERDVSISESAKARLARHILEQDDIVLARRGEMGRCAIVHKSDGEMLCGTGSARVRLDQRISNPGYIALLLSTKGNSQFLENQSNGATMANINTSILAHLPVLCPPLPVQQRIVGFVRKAGSSVNHLLVRVERSVEVLREYRQALITAAVTGQLDVAEKLAEEAVA